MDLWYSRTTLLALVVIVVTMLVFVVFLVLYINSEVLRTEEWEWGTRSVTQTIDYRLYI